MDTLPDQVRAITLIVPSLEAQFFLKFEPCQGCSETEPRVQMALVGLNFQTNGPKGHILVFLTD